MRRSVLILLAALPVLLSHPSFALAQRRGTGIGPLQQNAYAPTPALSPYLNLTRGGNPAANYYLGVLPEFDRRAFEANPPVNIPPNLLLPDVPERFEDILPGLPQTGHVVGYQYYGSYYNVPQQQRPYFPYSPQGAQGRQIQR